MRLLWTRQKRSASEKRELTQCKAGILRSECGQSAFELALLTPFVLAMLVGVIELGRYAYISILVGNAARAGAAYGAQTLAQAADTTGILKAADNDFQNNGQNVSKLTITSSIACGCDSGGNIAAAACNGKGAGLCGSGHWVVLLTVEAKGTFNSLFNYVSSLNSITMDRTCTMRVTEQ